MSVMPSPASMNRCPCDRRTRALLNKVMLNMKRAKHKKRLTVEQLEDRNLMSGMAWPGAQHLKVNFAPDGATVDSNYQSALFSSC